MKETCKDYVKSNAWKNKKHLWNYKQNLKCNINLINNFTILFNFKEKKECNISTSLNSVYLLVSNTIDFMKQLIDPIFKKKISENPTFFLNPLLI